VRALEDFWFHLIGPRWRDAALVAVFVFMVPSNILSLIIPIFGVVRPQEGIQQALLLPQDEFKAIRWLDANARPDQIVLAPPGPSLWIPSYSALRVVYGHPFETLNATQKRQEVMDWYAGQQCKELVEKYRVSYILTESDSQGQDTPTQAETCLQQLNLTQPVTTFGGVSIYHVTP
jgi:hypothetical protein